VVFRWVAVSCGAPGSLPFYKSRVAIARVCEAVRECSSMWTTARGQIARAFERMRVARMDRREHHRVVQGALACRESRRVIGTLGELVYAGTQHSLVAEREWVELVRAIALRNPAVLRVLYVRTGHLVFTLILRIVYETDVAEELMLDVFQQIWRRAPSYEPRGGSVVGWIMHQARLLASERQRSAGVEVG
jgi:hypothetical protein